MKERQNDPCKTKSRRERQETMTGRVTNGGPSLGMGGTNIPGSGQLVSQPAKKKSSAQCAQHARRKQPPFHLGDFTGRVLEQFSSLASVRSVAWVARERPCRPVQ